MKGEAVILAALVLASSLSGSLSRIDITIPMPMWFRKVPITRCGPVTFARFRSDDRPRLVHHCGQGYYVDRERPLEIVPECGLLNRKDYRYAVGTDQRRISTANPDGWGAVTVDLTERALPRVRKKRILVAY